MSRTKVTPFVGVWIEIGHLFYYRKRTYVTPFVGVWIEIDGICCPTTTSSVTPFVGVWIEIPELESISAEWGHSLRGSVD